MDTVGEGRLVVVDTVGEGETSCCGHCRRGRLVVVDTVGGGD